MDHPAMTIAEALEMTGCRSKYALAARLGVLRSSVQSWNPARIPNERRLQIIAGEMLPNPRPKISPEEAEQIRREHVPRCPVNGTAAQAQRYGVHRRTIARILASPRAR